MRGHYMKKKDILELKKRLRKITAPSQKCVVVMLAEKNIYLKI